MNELQIRIATGGAIVGMMGGVVAGEQIVHSLNHTDQYDPLQHQVEELQGDNTNNQAVLDNPSLALKSFGGRAALVQHIEADTKSNNEQITALVAREPHQLSSGTEIGIEVGGMLVGVITAVAIVRGAQGAARSNWFYHLRSSMRQRTKGRSPTENNDVEPSSQSPTSSALLYGETDEARHEEDHVPTLDEIAAAGWVPEIRPSDKYPVHLAVHRMQGALDSGPSEAKARLRISDKSSLLSADKVDPATGNVIIEYTGDHEFNPNRYDELLRELDKYGHELDARQYWALHSEQFLEHANRGSDWLVRLSLQQDEWVDNIQRATGMTEEQVLAQAISFTIPRPTVSQLTGSLTEPEILDLERQVYDEIGYLESLFANYADEDFADKDMSDDDSHYKPNRVALIYRIIQQEIVLRREKQRLPKAPKTVI